VRLASRSFIEWLSVKAAELDRSCPETIHHIQVTDLLVLDLTRDGLSLVGLNEADVVSNDWSSCQLVGQAAHFLGAAGVVAQSATAMGLTIAVFETRVHGELELIGAGEINSDELREPDLE
jgi:RES domain-containing protein